MRSTVGGAVSRIRFDGTGRAIVQLDDACQKGIGDDGLGMVGTKVSQKSLEVGRLATSLMACDKDATRLWLSALRRREGGVDAVTVDRIPVDIVRHGRRWPFADRSRRSAGRSGLWVVTASATDAGRRVVILPDENCDRHHCNKRNEDIRGRTLGHDLSVLHDHRATGHRRGSKRGHEGGSEAFLHGYSPFYQHIVKIV